MFNNPYMPNYMANYMPQYPAQQYTSPQPPTMMPQAPQAQQAGDAIKWVQGEEGAKAYLVAAGNSAMLMDSEHNTFYIKSTDLSGVPMPLRIFDYTERTQAARTAPTAAQQPETGAVTRAEFEALRAKLDDLRAQLGVTEAEVKQNG